MKAVEHFPPQATFKELRNEWNNLLLACAQCNGKKSNRFPVILSTQENEDKVIYLKEEQAGEPAMIDPCVVDPERHIADEVADALNYGVIKARDDARWGPQRLRPSGSTQNSIRTVGIGML